MTDPRRASRAAALLPIVLIFAACGGSTTSAAPTTTGAATASPTLAAGSPGVEASPSGPDLAIPSFDISQLTAGLANLDSYRVAITSGGEATYTGVVVTKPVLSRDVTVADGTRIVVIGNDAWISQDGGTLTAVPATMATQLFAAYDPTLLVGAFSGLALAQNATSVGTEQKNGVSAKHYQIAGTSFFGAFASVSPDATIDVWISDQGYLVALETKGLNVAGKDLSIQVTNVNDPSNKVDKPS